MVAIKGQETDKSKFGISDALTIINFCALGYGDHWYQKIDDILVRRVEKTEYLEIRESVNEFMDFFFRSFGDDKRANPLAYTSRCIRAVVAFYCILKKSGNLSSEKKKNAAIKKMRSYVLTANFKIMDEASRILALVSHFNLGKKTGRILYEPSRP